MHNRFHSFWSSVTCEHAYESGNTCFLLFVVACIERSNMLCASDFATHFVATERPVLRRTAPDRGVPETGLAMSWFSCPRCPEEVRFPQIFGCP